MLGIFGKKFKKASAEATAAMSKNVNRDLMQAVVYGAIFIAAADGDLAEAELKKTEKLIANNPLLKGLRGRTERHDRPCRSGLQRWWPPHPAPKL
ncbi:hypothetical protein [Pseudomonas sp. Bc-h]|uniref:hypothetical protein n=1 Tax=Pseudomonas sp. Bc-h TaxID=1943632 RepID=UPI001E28609D|nr:hypothetical protein [Pseudomonas sp. Bc-h]